MPLHMPDSHISVKRPSSDYAQRVVATCLGRRQNGGMKNLQTLRRSRGMTQTQLAEAAGCNQATISKIEKGGNYTLALAERIATVLRVAPVELFGVSELEQRYLSALRAASPEKQRAILLLLEGSDE